jgi:nondiscriminating aspartyl-tRNA synthetase
MERTLISKIKEGLEQVELKGRILNLRKLGNISFVLLQDYTGQIQIVFEKMEDVKLGDLILVRGKVVKDDRAKTGFEIHGEEIEVISSSIEDLPFDISKKDLKLQLSNLLDFRTTSLRHPKVQAIFKLYDILLEEYEAVMREEGFTEVKTPKIIETASEGGANFFKIKYFEKEAFLAQSPQLYKQILIGVFERVFEIGTIFRAEPHFTTRHINEFTGLDAEMGMINSFHDVTAMLNKVFIKIFEGIKEKGQKYLDLYEVELSSVPDKIPHVKLTEIKKIIKDKYNYSIPTETDIDPEGERLASRYAKEEFNSDFLFITHYPWKEKPFYTMPNKENPEETLGFDLIFKGVEIATGSQRIHKYEELVENMRKKGVNPKGLEFYLETFKFSMPPHGGWGLGSERIIQLILNLGSIKEAVLFPRDVKRLRP